MVGALADPVLRDALILSPAKQIHTVGMKVPIDVVFCDKRWRVVHLVRAMRPRRVTRIVLTARYVIEMAAGEASQLSTGDVVTFA